MVEATRSKVNPHVICQKLLAKRRDLQYLCISQLKSSFLEAFPEGVTSTPKELTTKLIEQSGGLGAFYSTSHPSFALQTESGVASVLGALLKE